MYAVASHFPVQVVHTATLHVATGCQAQKRQKKHTVKAALKLYTTGELSLQVI